jgi:hypothetical protein
MYCNYEIKKKEVHQDFKHQSKYVCLFINKEKNLITLFSFIDIYVYRRRKKNNRIIGKRNIQN